MNEKVLQPTAARRSITRVLASLLNCRYRSEPCGSGGEGRDSLTAM